MRVYPAESDPRQAKEPGLRYFWGGEYLGWESSVLLAREFGPWVRGADGRWQRDRRKR